MMLFTVFEVVKEIRSRQLKRTLQNESPPSVKKHIQRVSKRDFTASLAYISLVRGLVHCLKLPYYSKIHLAFSGIVMVQYNFHW
jgi:hypothetical protein